MPTGAAASGSSMDKPWGPLFGKVGFQLNDDFAGNANYTISAELTRAGIGSTDARWSTGAWLGQTNGLYSRLYVPLGDFDHFYVMPDATTRADTVPLYSRNQEIAQYRFHYRHLGIEGGWSPAPEWNFALRAARGNDQASVKVGSRDVFPNVSSDWASARFSVTFDNLDETGFPTRGARIEADYEAYRTFLGGQADGNVARFTGDWALNWGYGPFKRYTILLGARASISHGNSAFMESLEPLDFLGGFLNLSGHTERSLLGDQSALGRVVAYRRMGGSLKDVFGVPLYLGASVEAGNVWNERSDMSFNDLIYSGSVFGGIDTSLGPMFLGFGHSSDGANAWYLTFGSMLRPRL